MSVTLMMAMLIGAEPVALAADEQFSVYAPTETVANAVLSEAQRAYRDIAEEWLLTTNTNVRTIIHIRTNANEEYGKSILVERGSKRQSNIVWIHTRDGRHLETGTLWHEIAHCVLAEQFQGTLPAMIHEGCAARYDTGIRKRLIQQAISRLAKTRQWSEIQPMLARDALNTADVEQYALSIAFVEFLLSRGNRAKLLRFGQLGRTTSWKHAIQEHYEFRGTKDLELTFTEWAHKNYGPVKPSISAATSSATISPSLREVGRAHRP